MQPSVLAARHGAGVTKKTKRKAAASARARRKHERGVEMAEAVSERTSNKVEKSVRQAKAIKRRAKTWEEVNNALEAEEAGKPGKGAGNLFAALGGGGEEESEEEEMGDAGGKAPARAVVPVMVQESMVDEDEEIL